jgi:hypothetical protein
MRDSPCHHIYDIFNINFSEKEVKEVFRESSPASFPFTRFRGIEPYFARCGVIVERKYGSAICKIFSEMIGAHLLLYPRAHYYWTYGI